MRCKPTLVAEAAVVVVSVWMKEWRGDSTERSRLLLTTMNIKRNLDSQGEDGGGEEPAKQQQPQEAGMGQAAEDEEDVDALAEMYKVRERGRARERQRTAAGPCEESVVVRTAAALRLRHAGSPDPPLLVVMLGGG